MTAHDRVDDATRGRSRAATLAVLGLTVLALAGAGLVCHRLWKGAAADPGAPEPGAPHASRTASTETLQTILESAQSYIRRGEPQTAETVLAAAARQYTQSQELHTAYADLLLSQRKTSQAYEEYQRALAIGPRTAVLEFTAGNAANMAGKPDLALEHFSAAQTADPADATYPVYLAQIQLKLGQADAAKVSLLRAARLDPDRAVAWGTMAEIALRENNLDLARQHVAKARALEPQSVPWRLIEARALKRAGEPQAALNLLVGLADADRFQGPVLKLIAECYGMLSKPSDAAALYAKASETAPQDAEMALGAAEWHRRAGDREQAMRFAQRAADLGDDAGQKLVKRLAEGG